MPFLHLPSRFANTVKTKRLPVSDVRQLVPDYRTSIARGLSIFTMMNADGSFYDAVLQNTWAERSWEDAGTQATLTKSRNGWYGLSFTAADTNARFLNSGSNTFHFDGGGNFSMWAYWETRNGVGVGNNDCVFSIGSDVSAAQKTGFQYNTTGPNCGFRHQPSSGPGTQSVFPSTTGLITGSAYNEMYTLGTKYNSTASNTDLGVVIQANGSQSDFGTVNNGFDHRAWGDANSRNVWGALGDSSPSEHISADIFASATWERPVFETEARAFLKNPLSALKLRSATVYSFPSASAGVVQWNYQRFGIGGFRQMTGGGKGG